MPITEPPSTAPSSTAPSDTAPPSTEARTITTEAELRERLGEAGRLVLDKELDHVDAHARTIIEHSPFVLLATADAAGRCDVTPRGDPPGSVLVLDERTLVLAERPGNRRFDSLRNIIANPEVGLLFVVPGMNETLRVNGAARVVAEADFFDRLLVRGRRPVAAIVIEVRELFMHCAKAFVRSGLWQPATWPDRAELPSGGAILRAHCALDTDVAALDAGLAEDVRTNQY